MDLREIDGADIECISECCRRNVHEEPTADCYWQFHWVVYHVAHCNKCTQLLGQNMIKVQRQTTRA